MSYGGSSYQGGVGGASSSQTQFQKLSKRIEQNIQAITKNVRSIEISVDQIGTDKDTKEMREKLHKLQHGTNQLAKDTAELMMQVNNLPKDLPDNRTIKIQLETLTKQFTSALDQFQRLQRREAEKEKESFRRAKANSGYDKNPFESQNDPKLVDFEQDQIQIQIDQNVDLELLRERENQIKKLENDIVGVNEIFKELGMMVHSQGEIIDTIEHNVESTASSVQQGRTQLARAQNYQTSARKKKIILLIIGIIILIIIILIIYFSVKK